jgi:hypothetical protein
LPNYSIEKAIPILLRSSVQIIYLNGNFIQL